MQVSLHSGYAAGLMRPTGEDVDAKVLRGLLKKLQRAIHRRIGDVARPRPRARIGVYHAVEADAQDRLASSGCPGHTPKMHLPQHAVTLHPYVVTGNLAVIKALFVTLQSLIGPVAKFPLGVSEDMPSEGLSGGLPHGQTLRGFYLSHK